MQLIEKTNESSEKNELTCGVFVAFDTVDHQILLKNLEQYSIVGNNLRWFENYFKYREQFISFEHNSSKNATVTCSVPQGSILGPLLFLLCVNDLNHASKLLNLIMFATF